jgi:hypothetical protein
VWVQAVGLDVLFRRKVAGWAAASGALLALRGGGGVHDGCRGDGGEGGEAGEERDALGDALGVGLGGRAAIDARRRRRLVTWADLMSYDSEEERLAAVEWAPPPSLAGTADLLHRLQPPACFAGPDPARLTGLCRQTLFFPSPRGALAGLSAIAADPDVAAAGPAWWRGRDGGEGGEAAEGVVLRVWLGSAAAVRLGLDEHVCEVCLALSEAPRGD